MTKSLPLIVLGLCTGPVLAATPLEELFGSEETVSIATGRAHNYRTAPAVATVITAEMIRNGGYRHVVEALQLVPGFHLGWTSSYFPNLAVRGFSGLWSGNVLFLLDGVAQSDRITGNALSILGTIPLDVIDRIEVTRGPGSAVFSAEAFSAVVNVITRQRVEHDQVTLSAGSERTADGRLLLGGESGSGALVLGAEAMTTDGQTPTIATDRLSQLDALLGSTLSQAPATVPTARQNLGVLVNARLGATRGMLRLARGRDDGLGAGLLGVIDPTGSRYLQTIEARLDHEQRITDRLALTLRLDAEQTRLAFDALTWFPPSALFPQGLRFNSSAEQSVLRGQMDVRFAAGDWHFLTTGVGYELAHDTIDAWTPSQGIVMATGLQGPLGAAGPGPSAQRALIAGYAQALTQLLSAPSSTPEKSAQRRLVFGYLQDEWLIAPKWSLTWGVRLDDYSDVGTQVSPRAVLVWTPLPEWTAKLLYGEGFRAPTRFETQGGLLPIFQPNAALKPERLRTAELAIQYQPKPGFALGLNLFRHQTVDQIRQQDLQFYSLPENVGRQVGQGAELELKWALTHDLSFRGWSAYQSNTDETTGQDAGYSPHHQVYGSLQYQLGRTFFNLQGSYVGDRARVAEDPRQAAPKYGWLDLLIRHDLTRAVSLQLDIRNLLNGNLLEAAPGTSLPQDLPLAQRNYYASIEVRF